MVRREDREVVVGKRIPIDSDELLSLLEIARKLKMTDRNVLHMVRTGRKGADGRMVRLQVIKTSAGLRTTLKSYWEMENIIAGYVEHEDTVNDPVSSWTKNWLVIDDFVLFRFCREDLHWLIQHMEESDALRCELADSMERLVAVD